LAVLRRRRTPMALGDLVATLRAGVLPSDAVAVTFDDGYADNLYAAEPVLADAGVPATLFLKTNTPEEGHSFWWDELEALIFGARLEQGYCIDIGEKRFEIAPSRDSENDRSHAGWRAWDVTQNEREKIYFELWCEIKHLRYAHRRAVIDELRGALGPVPEPGDKRPMTQAEIQGIAARGLFEIGAHTVTHPALTMLTRQDCLSEMIQSKVECERILGRAVSGLSYPYGDMDENVRQAARDAGFSWACSAEPRPISGPTEDTYALPRYQVFDCPGDLFEKTILMNMQQDWVAKGNM